MIRFWCGELNSRTFKFRKS